MTEYRNAWYQGTAFAMFFPVARADRDLRHTARVRVGDLHFMAFYTAIEGVLLSNGRKQSLFFTVLTKGVYLLLFPVMLVTFTCYELGFEEYALLVPVFAVAGVVVLMIGALSYFLYDPYRMDRRNRKKANRYIVEIEKAALKEVRLKERAFAKQEKKAGEVTRKEEARAQKKARAGRAPQTAEGGAGRKACTLARMVEREAGAA